MCGGLPLITETGGERRGGIVNGEKTSNYLMHCRGLILLNGKAIEGKYYQKNFSCDQLSSILHGIQEGLGCVGCLNVRFSIYYHFN